MSVKTVKKMLVLRPVLKEKEESEQQSVRSKQIRHLNFFFKYMDHAIVYHTDTVSKQIQSLKHQHTHTLMHASAHSDMHTYGHTPWYHTDNVSKQIQSLKHQHTHTDAC